MKKIMLACLFTGTLTALIVIADRAWHAWRWHNKRLPAEVR